MESIINYLDKFSNEITIILLCFAAIILAVFMWVFVYNRRRFQHLKHQIPAAVVKNYLDSIIQNSASLKSSLFRGGGMDVDPSGIPSVMPLGELAGGGQASVGNASAEEVNSLNAEIARLMAQLDEKKFQVSDLETKNSELSGDNKTKQARIEELEALLAAAGDGTGGADPAALAAITKERDELKEKLQEYSIIEDDLANLKRLQQENEQLKKALEAAGGAAPAAAEPVAEEPAAVEEPVAEEPVAEEPVAEEPVAEEPVAEEPVAAAEPDTAPEAPSEDKSPEDLLSEFEKMLG